MNQGNEVAKQDTAELLGHMLWLNARALGLVVGLLSGFVIFFATNWLVIKSGDPVGPHLALLSQYFIGYRVSFVGSLIGFAYAFLVGGLSGLLVAWIYNRIGDLRVGLED